MTPTTDPTTTPPAEAEGDAALNAAIAGALEADGNTLNAEIARLFGWTCAISVEDEPPYPYLKWTHGETGEVRWNVPARYDRDPAACLGLLAHVLALRRPRVAGGEDLPRFECSIYQQVNGGWQVTIGSWEGISDEEPAEADTLERAIARSCLAALVALRGEGEADKL